MGLVLYDHAASSNALKARFLLAELGLEHERVHVSMRFPRPDWYLEINPFGRVPLLEDGAIRLAESNAILRYLALRERRDDLYPAEPADRARVDWTIDAWSTLVRPALLPAEKIGLMDTSEDEGAVGDPAAADPAALAGAVEGARGPLAQFERLVADNGTVIGSFTIADCCIAPLLWRWKRLPLSFDELPRLARIQEAVSTRPSFAAAGPVA
jgi:glutathione S-transferase